MYHFTRVSSLILTLDQKLNDLYVPYHEVCAKMKHQLYLSVEARNSYLLYSLTMDNAHENE